MTKELADAREVLLEMDKIVAELRADLEQRQLALEHKNDEIARLTEAHARMKQLWENTEADLAVAKSDAEALKR